MPDAIFAFDFSMNKPAMCCSINNTISFYVWPSTIDEKSKSMLEAAGVNIFSRNLCSIKEKSLNTEDLIQEHVTRATELANMIADTIDSILLENKITDKSNCVIANESFSFGSKGDAMLDLAGYKYVLLYVLMQRGFSEFKTYSPITIKSTAGCAKKGSTKDDMIHALGTEQPIHKLINTIMWHPENLKKKTNFCMCVDDLADSYWCMKTYLKKNECCCN